MSTRAELGVARVPAGTGELALDAAALQQGLLYPAPEVSWTLAGQKVRLRMDRDRPLRITEHIIEIPVELQLADQARLVRSMSGWRPAFDRIQGRWSLALVQVEILSVTQTWEPDESPVRVPIASRWSFPSLTPGGLEPNASPAEPGGAASSKASQPLQAFLQGVRLEPGRVVLELGFRTARSAVDAR